MIKLIKFSKAKTQEISSADIYIWQDKVFVPSPARYKSGIRTGVEPIQIVDPNIEDLVSAVEKVLKTKPKLLPDPSREEVKIQSGLLPKVTGARSWKRLYQMSYYYVIVQTEEGYTLEIPRLAPKGGWLFDPNHRKSFPVGTDLSLVIQALLDDLATRSK